MSHSLTNPLSGGRAEMATAPIRKKKAVFGIRLISPPISSMFAGVRRVQDGARAQEQQRLEDRVVDGVIQPGDQRQRRQHRMVACAGTSRPRPAPSG